MDHIFADLDRLTETGTPRLCFVDYKREMRAYFTTQPVQKQWGDDWDDAPYEHNAGPPYPWSALHEGRGCECVDPDGYTIRGPNACGSEDHVPAYPRARWQILEIPFRTDLIVPGQFATNSQYAVQDFNQKEVPWLKPLEQVTRKHRPQTEIWAGTPLSAFAQTLYERDESLSLPLFPEALLLGRNPEHMSALLKEGDQQLKRRVLHRLGQPDREAEETDRERRSSGSSEHSSGRER